MHMLSDKSIYCIGNMSNTRASASSLLRDTDKACEAVGRVLSSVSRCLEP